MLKSTATDIIYLRARFCEPKMNRFAQKNIVRGSVVSGLSLNRYTYAEQFGNCAKTLEEAIEQNEAAQSNFEENYEGQAEEITTDTFGKIEEHLKLLVQCCQTTEAYVRDCLTSMQEADSKIGNSYQGG